MTSVKSALILLQFLTVAKQESGTRKEKSWSVTIYNQTYSSQMQLTDQIEPVHDKSQFQGMQTIAKYRFCIIKLPTYQIVS
jgi:hypothetical protein